MPASIALHAICYATPDGTPLFSDLTLNFGPGRTGLIGRNGTGKSTLLRIIAGLMPPASGSVTITGSVGLLEQSVQMTSAGTVADQLGVTHDLAMLERLDCGVGSLDDASQADWTLPARIDEALRATGLDAAMVDRDLATLSGGQRTRLALARLPLAKPDIILLDEPTNNLDATGREAVTDLLRQWRGAAVVVSHDRTLLGEMDTIVELTSLGARSYGGNWDHYAERKAIELAAAQGELAFAERQVEQVDRKLQAVAERQARKDGAGKRKAARGDIPKIILGGMKENAENTSGDSARLATRQRGHRAETLNAARAKLEVLTPLSVRLVPTGLASGRTVLQALGLTGGPDTNAPVIDTFSLHLVGPERIAIVGPNGSGKTTLLRLLTGDLPPLAGSTRLMLPFAMLDQTLSLLDQALSIADNFRRLNPEADDNSVRTALARFMFRADAALQQVGTLSGGEMLRAGLAATIGGNQPPQLLILDEPTNHLDIFAIEELEAGLRDYDGALLVVSHDTAFLDRIGIDKTIDLTGAAT